GPAYSSSLEACAQRLNLSPKSVPYKLLINKHVEDMDEELLQALIEGCLHDVELTHTLAKAYLPYFPPLELPIVDMTVRMFTEPMFVGDADQFERIAETEWDRKNDTLNALCVTEKQLQSAAKFAELLRATGEMPPTKNGKNGEIPAFARTDEYMQ